MVSRPIARANSCSENSGSMRSLAKIGTMRRAPSGA
jgi:hypothetical protein